MVARVRIPADADDVAVGRHVDRALAVHERVSGCACFPGQAAVVAEVDIRAAEVEQAAVLGRGQRLPVFSRVETADGPRTCGGMLGRVLSFGVTVLPDPPWQRLVELMQLAEA